MMQNIKPTRQALVRIGIWLALAAFSSLSHAQESHSVFGTSRACSPSWPDGVAVPPIKITDRLVLAIPVKYLRYEWLNCRRSPAEIVRRRESLPLNAGAGFDFFLPDFSGYTIARFRLPSSTDEVHVAYVVSAKEIEVNPSYPAHYPANQLKNILRLSANPKKYRDIYGLRCYEDRILKTTMYCYSAQTGSDHQGILVTVEVPPFGPGVVNSVIRTNYFSKSYGGIEVAWSTNAKNLPRWHDIDAQIWKFLAAWNVAHQ